MDDNIEVIQYDDCIGISYRQPENEENVEELNIDFELINQRETEIIVCAEKQKSDYKIVELLLDPELSDQDVYDISQLSWHVVSYEGKKLPPVIGIWELSGVFIAACSKIVESKPLKQQLEAGIGNTLCPWPDYEIYNSMQELFFNSETSEVQMPFYTFSEFFQKDDIQHQMKDFPKINKADEYARYMRNLRTQIMALNDLGINCAIKKGDIDKMRKEIKSHEMDPKSTQSWSAVTHVLEDMPSFFVEETNPVPTDKKDNLIARIGGFGHLGESLDCVATTIYEKNKKTHIKTILVWLNPLYLEEAGAEEILNEASDYINNALTFLRIDKIEAEEEALPFQECSDCGNLLVPY